MGSQTVFFNVLLMLFYLFCGFLLVKSKKANIEHTKSISAILIYVCAPCLNFISIYSVDYSVENLTNAVLFALMTLLVQLCFLGILYLLLHKKYEDARYRVLSIGAIMGNVGFFGLPLITSLFPDQPIVAFYSATYSLTMNMLIFSLGVFLLTQDKKFVSFRSAVFNPSIIAMTVALPFFFFSVKIPALAVNTMTLLGKMTTPLCMLILGMRLASMDFRAIFAQKFAYSVSAFKLIVFPLFAYACVAFLPFFDPVFKTSVLVLSAAPSASLILVLAELHGKEQRLAENVVLMTTLFSIVTLPLLMLIFE